MAKRISLLLGMVVLVAAMIVPMLVFPSSAATYTAVKRFDSSSSTSGTGYKVLSSYPKSDFIATYEVIFNGSASDEQYTDADPIFLAATPYVNFCVKPTQGLVYIANGGFGGANPSPAVSKGYAFEWGKYYKFDFIVTTTYAQININGQVMCTLNKSMTVDTSKYWLLCPAHIQMDFLSDRMYYVSGECHHDVYGSNSGSNNILYKANNVVTWSDSGDYNSKSISAYDLEALHKTAYMVEQADQAYYQYSDTASSAMRGEFTSGNGYSNQTVNGETALIFDYQMEFDFVWWGWHTDAGVSQFGGGTNSWYIGYQPAFGKWGITANDTFGGPWTSLFNHGGDLTYDYVLQKGKRYHWKLRVTTSKTELWIDDILVVSSTTYKRTDNEYFIFYPKNCTVDFTNYDWFINVNGTWQRWGHINYATPTGPFNGAALCSQEYANGTACSWNGRNDGGYAASPSTPVLDSGEAIDYANSLYNNLSANDKARIRTTALTQGTNAYNAQQAIAAIGTVAMNSSSKALIDAAKTAYNNTDNAYRGKIRNASVLTAAETAYDNLCQAEANKVINAINAIGTVTVNSGTAISNARTAYNNCSYADARAKITNYGTLTAAETEYNTIRPVYDAIANIGAVTVNSGSAITSAENSYAALTDAQKAKITNYSTLTSARAEYSVIRPVYEQIEALGTIHLNSYVALNAAQTSYNALTSSQKSKVDAANTTTLAQAFAQYVAKKPTAYLNATPDSSKITANFYIKVPSSEIEYAQGLEINVAGTTAELGDLAHTDADGYRYYKLPLTKAARRMNEAMAYSLSGGDAEDGYQTDPFISGSKTVAEYCGEIINGSYGKLYKDAARAMLIYGAAAQVYFDYQTDDLPTAGLTGSIEPTAASSIPGSGFDSLTLKNLIGEDDAFPVSFSAYNISFEADTQIMLSFRIKEDVDANYALNWVKQNVNFGGNTDDALNAQIAYGTEFTYVWVSLRNIPLSDLAVGKTIAINGAGNFSISVMNYIYVASHNGNENLSRMTRALYDYYNAVMLIAG